MCEVLAFGLSGLNVQLCAQHDDDVAWSVGVNQDLLTELLKNRKWIF